MKVKIDINLSVNRVVKYLVLVDLFLFAGWGFVQPVFSIFIKERIQGATLITVGAAGAVYWILKSLVQLPVASYLDKTDGEKDDFYALLISLVMLGIVAFWFPLIDQKWQLYLIQAVFALSFGLYTPAWSGIFSRHLDADRHSFDWSLDSTVLGLAAGISGALGGVAAEIFGFSAIFVAAGVLSLASATLLFWVPELVLPKATSEPAPPPMRTPKFTDSR